MRTAPAINALKRPCFRAAARRFVGDDAGATAIEYGLIVSLIFLAIIGAVNGYVNATSEMYSEITSTLADG
jgi:pilus assembly protein Flp/PilA